MGPCRVIPTGGHTIQKRKTKLPRADFLELLSLSPQWSLFQRPSKDFPKKNRENGWGLPDTHKHTTHTQKEWGRGGGREDGGRETERETERDFKCSVYLE